MQNHLDAGYKELPLVIPMLFIMVAEVLILIHSAGLMNLPTCYSPQNIFIGFSVGGYYRGPDDEIMQHRKMALLELIQKQFVSAICWD